MAQRLDGKIVRDKIAENLKSIIHNLSSTPKLIIIQVGDLTESNTYINQKIKFADMIGAIVELKKLPADVTEENLKSTIFNLNSDSTVHGIIIQMPIPESLDKNALIELIDPQKDVDGQTTTNQKLLEDGKIDTSLLVNHPRLSVIPAKAGIGIYSDADQILDQVENDKNGAQNNTALIPATAKGVITLLKFYGIDINDKKVTVIGRSKLVGAPLATLFRNLGAQVTVCHSQTLDLKAETKNADILVVAVGKQDLITKDHVSAEQIVIDVGINVANDHEPSTMNHKRSLVGDVNFAEVEPIVAAITPVPGGIGPMTVASLFENLLEAYKKQTG